MALILDTSVTPAANVAKSVYRPILIKCRSTLSNTKFLRVTLFVDQIDTYSPAIELDAELVIGTTDEYQVDISKPLQDLLAPYTSPRTEVGWDNYPYVQQQGFSDGGSTLVEAIGSYARVRYTIGEFVLSNSEVVRESVFVSGFGQSFIVHNSTIKYEEDETDFDRTYTIGRYGPFDHKFMTDSPDVPISFGDEYFVHINYSLPDEKPAITLRLSVNAYDSTGTLADTQTLDLTTGTFNTEIGTRQIDKSYGNNYVRLVFPCGPKNLATRGWGYYNAGNDLLYYTVHVERTDGAKYSETKRFDIVPNCSAFARRFYWMNRRGGIDGVTLNTRETEVHNTEFETIKRQLGSGYQIGQPSLDKIGIDAVDSFESETGRITAARARWIKEMLSSPRVWVQEGLNPIPIVISESSTRIVDASRNHNIQFSYRYAFTEETQRN